jgi:uncharacterized protein (DUF697 family)
MADSTFQGLTGEAIVNTFKTLGGNSAEAERKAKEFSSVDSWVTWQATQAAVVGGTAAAIPGAHLVTMAADIAILMHKMAWCSWGVGSVMGCEIEGDLDLALILGLWSGSITKEDVETMLVGGVVLGGALATAMTVSSSPALAAKIAAKTASFGTTVMAQKLGLKMIAGPLGSVSGFVAQNLMQQFAAKIAVKIGKVAASRVFLGFVPFIGPIVGGTINAIFVNAIAGSARTYYELKKNS